MAKKKSESKSKKGFNLADVLDRARLFACVCGYLSHIGIYFLFFYWSS